MSKRTVQKIYFHTDHRDAEGNVSTTEFQYSFGANYYVKSIALTDLVMPNSYYNVNSLNNRLVLVETTNAVTIDVNIPEGQYILGDDDTTEYSFLKAIKDALDAESKTQNGDLNKEVYSVSVDYVTHKISITTVAGNVVLDYSAAGNSTIQGVLGLGDSDLSGTTLVMPCIYDLSGVTNVYIRATNITTKTRVEGKESNVLAKVFLDTDFGTVVMNNEGKMWESNFHDLTQPTRLDKLVIQCTDQAGNILDNNSLPWQATIELKL
jgi:hypothetical protein